MCDSVPRWMLVVAALAFLLGLALGALAGDVDYHSDCRPQKLAYRKQFPNCEACFRRPTVFRRMEVHHILPIKQCLATGQTNLIYDAANFITLCDGCHDFAHPMDYHHYTANLRDILQRREIKP